MNPFDNQSQTYDNESRRIEAADAIAHAMIHSLEIRSDMSLMEYGAGTGLVTLHFQPLVKKIAAIDSSRGMLEVLERKIRQQEMDNIGLLWLDGMKNAIPRWEYDIAICSMTFHHIKNTDSILSQFNDSLKQPGQLALVDLDKEEGDFHSDNDGVEHFGFDREPLAKMAENIGFHSIRFSTPYVIKKKTAAGVDKDYPLFLMLAKK
ncbi:MAG: class I SAM-dependent methyltransferase [Candidatus Omnitrophota bacterium]